MTSTKFLAMTALSPTMDRFTGNKNIKPDLYWLLPHIQSAPAHQSRTTGHKREWDITTILTTTRDKKQLDLTEHAASKTRDPHLTVQTLDSAPSSHYFLIEIVNFLCLKWKIKTTKEIIGILCERKLSFLFFFNSRLNIYNFMFGCVLWVSIILVKQ